MNTYRALLASFSFLLWIANPSGIAFGKSNQTQIYFSSNLPFLLGNAGIWSRCSSVSLYLCFFEQNTISYTNQSNSNLPQPIEIDTKTQKSLNLKLETPLSQNLTPGLTTIGRVEGQPKQVANVPVPDEGTIVTLMVNLGDSVRQGQAIAVVSRPSRISQATSASETQSELLAAQARLQKAEANYQLQQSLAQAEIIQSQLEIVASEKESTEEQIFPTQATTSAQASYQQALMKADIYAAQQELQAAKSALEAAKNRGKIAQMERNSASNSLNSPEYIPIVAPVTGKITSLNLTDGEAIPATDSSIVTIAEYDQIWLIAMIKAKDYPQIAIGQEVKVKVQQFPNQTFTGKIKDIPPQLLDKSAHIPIRIQLNNSGGQLQPGMEASVEILTGENYASRLLISKKAIINYNNQYWLYRKAGLNSYQPVKVSLGETIGNLVEVEGDLWSKDQIITEGANRLYTYSLEQNHQNYQILSWLMVLGLGVGITGGILIFKSHKNTTIKAI